ncbi:MAG: putative toxin-antitoxin system toxin component, PIN family [Planctomycetes bacterium]|nr:putative toxin-antitoxin system toxin component, PIN family [Planctomycetota bacterium]
MRIVLDTNVLVAGLLSPFGPPAAVLQLLLAEKVRICYDARILTEYRTVLARARFGFDPGAVAAVQEFLEQTGDLVVPAPWPDSLPDPADAMFLEVAVAGGAAYVVTGNVRHFPAESRRGVAVVSPAEFLETPDVRGL